MQDFLTAMLAETGRPRARDIAGEYLETVQSVLASVDLESVTRVVQRLALARDCARTIFIAGNGGSAATATHFANDLSKATRRPGFTLVRAMSLSDNVSWLTALANDEGYERVFAAQLENFAQPGDVLVTISASGNSANLVRAVEVARARGVFVIGLLGFDGGVLKSLADEYIWVPTVIGAYGPAEDAHAMLCHMLTVCLANEPATA